MKVIILEGRSVDFKGKLYLPGKTLDVPEKEAKRLLDKDVCKPYDDGIIVESPALKDMTIPELKKLLDKLGITYSERAPKDDLIAMVEANTAEPPGE